MWVEWRAREIKECLLDKGVAELQVVEEITELMACCCAARGNKE